jgi:hypothetical protein
MQSHSEPFYSTYCKIAEGDFLNKTLAIAAILSIVALFGIGIGYAKLTEATPLNVDSRGTLDDFGCNTQWSITNAGESTASYNGIHARLVDVDVAQEPVNAHPAIYDILNRRNVVIEQVQILPGHVHRGSYQGRNYYISTLTTTPGFTINARWSEQLFTVCHQ